MFNLTSVTSTAFTPAAAPAVTSGFIVDKNTVEFQINFRPLGRTAVPVDKKGKRIAVGSCGSAIKRTGGDGFLVFSPFIRKDGERLVENAFYYEEILPQPTAEMIQQATAVAKTLGTTEEAVLQLMLKQETAQLVKTPLSLEQVELLFSQIILDFDICEPELQASLEEDIIEALEMEHVSLQIQFKMSQLRYVGEDSYTSNKNELQVTYHRKKFSLDEDVNIEVQASIRGRLIDLSEGLEKAKAQKNQVDKMPPLEKEALRAYLAKFSAGYPDGWGDGKHLVHFKMLHKFRETDSYEAVLATAIPVLLRLADNPAHKGIKSRSSLARKLKEELGIDLAEWEKEEASAVVVSASPSSPQEGAIIDM